MPVDPPRYSVQSTESGPGPVCRSSVASSAVSGTLKNDGRNNDDHGNTKSQSHGIPILMTSSPPSSNQTPSGRNLNAAEALSMMALSVGKSASKGQDSDSGAGAAVSVSTTGHENHHENDCEFEPGAGTEKMNVRATHKSHISKPESFWKPYNLEKISILLDRHENPCPPYFSVVIDKGCTWASEYSALLFQKKNHFQISASFDLCGASPTFVKPASGGPPCPIGLDSFVVLDLAAIKVESTGDVIPIVQSTSDRRKQAYVPTKFSPCPASTNVGIRPSTCTSFNRFRATATRLHFSAPTANNQRKKNEMHHDQRYFKLVATAVLKTGGLSFPLACLCSDHVVVRASNPRRFMDMVDTSQGACTSPGAVYNVTKPTGSNGGIMPHRCLSSTKSALPESRTGVSGDVGDIARMTATTSVSVASPAKRQRASRDEEEEPIASAGQISQGWTSATGSTSTRGFDLSSLGCSPLASFAGEESQPRQFRVAHSTPSVPQVPPEVKAAAANVLAALLSPATQTQSIITTATDKKSQPTSTNGDGGNLDNPVLETAPDKGKSVSKQKQNGDLSATTACQQSLQNQDATQDEGQQPQQQPIPWCYPEQSQLLQHQLAMQQYQQMQHIFQQSQLLPWQQSRPPLTLPQQQLLMPWLPFSLLHNQTVLPGISNSTLVPPQHPATSLAPQQLQGSPAGQDVMVSSTPSSSCPSRRNSDKAAKIESNHFMQRESCDEVNVEPSEVSKSISVVSFPAGRDSPPAVQPKHCPKEACWVTLPIAMPLAPVFDTSSQPVATPVLQAMITKGCIWSDEYAAYICQKKNHFEVKALVSLPSNIGFVRPADGSDPKYVKNEPELFLELYAVKSESPSVAIPVMQSVEERRKAPYVPIRFSAPLHGGKRTAMARKLHFSGPTSNNQRKHNRVHPDQRFMWLVASVMMRIDDVLHPIAVARSGNLVIRASNPRQFLDVKSPPANVHDSIPSKTVTMTDITDVSSKSSSHSIAEDEETAASGLVVMAAAAAAVKAAVDGSQKPPSLQSGGAGSGVFVPPPVNAPTRRTLGL